MRKIQKHIISKTWRNACKILVGKPEAKRPLGRAMHRWDGVDWIHLIQQVP
jgi:hypothetical protein